MELRSLSADGVTCVADIDRSEHVDVEYCVVDGVLAPRPASMPDIPRWLESGDGDATVAHKIEFCAARLAEGGELFGVFDGDETMGIAIVHPDFEGDLAWLSFLHVSRPHRRRGVAQTLWDEAVDRARAAGAARLYVSATPTESAVGFYLRQGCVLADRPHPQLFEAEPSDIHLVCPLG